MSPKSGVFERRLVEKLPLFSTFSLLIDGSCPFVLLIPLIIRLSWRKDDRSGKQVERKQKIQIRVTTLSFVHNPRI